jgi:Tfp pilus assembly protein PilZ
VTIDIPVSARVADIGMIEAHISDLSIGGLALRCGQPLQLDREVIVQFNLPDGGRRMHVTGKVVNANATGRAGIRFSFVPEDDLEALESWLATELAKLESVEIPA